MKNSEILSSIKANVKKYRELALDEVKNAKEGFSLAEKALMDRFLVVLNDKVKEAVSNGVSFKEDLKGRGWKIVGIFVGDWPEYITYRSFIDDDPFHRTLRGYLYNSLSKYGISENEIFAIEFASYTNACNIRYNLLQLGEPTPGRENFYT